MSLLLFGSRSSAAAADVCFGPRTWTPPEPEVGLDARTAPSVGPQSSHLWINNNCSPSQSSNLAANRSGDSSSKTETSRCVNQRTHKTMDDHVNCVLPPPKKRKMLLSRALLALCVESVARVRVNKPTFKVK